MFQLQCDAVENLQTGNKLIYLVFFKGVKVCIKMIGRRQGWEQRGQLESYCSI